MKPSVCYERLRANMGGPREEQFRKLVQSFPHSPMGHFSLGKLLLDERRYGEAAESLSEAVRLDATYAAALVSLGDALVGAGRVEEARGALERAGAAARAQRHPSLAEEIEARLETL